MFLEFFDGIWGHYTFESDKVNTLIDALPSFAYPLGQLVFLILVYRLLVHQYIKRFLTMYLSIYVIGIKKRLRKSKLSLLVLPIVYLFVFGMTYVLGGNVLATVTVYKDYRGLKTIYSQVDKIDIRYLGSKSSSTRIDAVFIDSDGQIYDMHLINGDKRIANHIRHNQSMSYSSTLSFDKHGKPLYISKFLE